jgi:hypothetical protein
MAHQKIPTKFPLLAHCWKIPSKFMKPSAQMNINLGTGNYDFLQKAAIP